MPISNCSFFLYCLQYLRGGSVNMRKDLIEVIYMSKKRDIKVNYAEIARLYCCAPRMVKACYERDVTKPCAVDYISIQFKLIILFP